MKYIIATGDCFNGLCFYCNSNTERLFDTYDEALEFAELICGNKDEWHIVEVYCNA